MDIVRTAIGLMSGTSMDGIDVALLRTDGRGYIERGPFLGVPYDAAFRDRLKHALELARPLNDRAARPGELRDIEIELTQRHAAAVTSFLEKFGIGHGDVDVLGFHGQTILHRPDDALTIQIGDGRMLAESTGIPVVYDMRANDMAHGGQGAPLVPAYHAALSGRFQKEGQSVCFVNIGGISNLTYIGADGRISAFDSGPGNTLIDQWVEMQTGQTYDPGGEIAARGQVVPEIAARYLDSPFFRGNIRRSLDRGDFKPLAEGDANLEGGARTLAHVAAASIIRSAGFLPDNPSVYIVCGGGRLNAAVMAEFSAMAGERASRVMSAEEAGFDGDAMEAEAWAYLAVRSLEGLPLTYPGTTGVGEPVSGGVLANAAARTILETERLRLVMWDADDARLVHDLHSTLATSRFMAGGAPWPMERCEERVQQWFREQARDGTTKYKVLSKEDDHFIGRAGISLHDGDIGEYEMGYAFREEEWGKGYATEVARALIDWFSAKGTGKLIAFTHPENYASQHVLKKAGMRPVAPRLIDGFVAPTFEAGATDLKA